MIDPAPGCETLEYANPDGDSIRFVTLVEVTGRMMPPIAVTSIGVPAGHGASFRGAYHQERPVVTPVAAPGVFEDRAELRRWARVLDPAKGEGTLTVVEGEWAGRRLRCVYEAGLDELAESSRSPLQATLIWRAAYPYWEDAVESSESVAQDATLHNWFPFLPLVLGASDSFESFQVTNEGDVISWPVMTVTGPATDMEVVNVTTGQLWHVTGAVAAGATLTVDTRPGYKTVDVDGVNAFGRLTPQSSLWGLAPGVNEVTVGGALTTSATSITFHLAAGLVGGMSGVTFTLYVADGTEWLAEVDTYETAEIVGRFNDVSTWTVTLPTKTAAAQYLLEATQPRVVFASAPTVVFRSGPVVAFDRENTWEGDLLTVSGVDDMVWLRRRLAHPQPGTPNPPYSTTAYDTRTGSASQVIAQFVDANAGPGAVAARRVADLTVPVPAPMGPTVKVAARYQNLLTMLQRTANRAHLGIEIRDLEFTVFQPTGPNAVFSVELGTLAGWRSLREAPGANYVYVAGGRKGTNRLIREYVDVDSAAEWGRLETFDDRRDTTDTTELDEAGAEVLADLIPTIELDLQTLDTASQGFLTDWQLGDRATVHLDGETITDTIRQVTITLEANMPPTVVPTIGGHP